MIVTHTNSTSYREGNIVLTVDMLITSPTSDGCVKVAKDTYYLEINGDTIRMDSDTFDSLKHIMKKIMGIEEQ